MKLSKLMKIWCFALLATVVVAAQAGGQTYIFANNGGYWKQYPASGPYWYTDSGDGYCGQYGLWCSPTYMRYTTNLKSEIDYWAQWYVWNEGKQQVFSNGYAFIPDTKATTRNATYFIYYVFDGYPGCHSAAAPYDERTSPSDNPNYFISHINQLNYSDQFASLWNGVAAIKCIDLVDWTNETNGWYYVGFDEIKVAY